MITDQASGIRFPEYFKFKYSGPSFISMSLLGVLIINLEIEKTSA